LETLLTSNAPQSQQAPLDDSSEMSGSNNSITDSTNFIRGRSSSLTDSRGAASSDSGKGSNKRKKSCEIISASVDRFTSSMVNVYKTKMAGGMSDLSMKAISNFSTHVKLKISKDKIKVKQYFIEKPAQAQLYMLVSQEEQLQMVADILGVDNADDLDLDE
jgi:hypothetical protein